MLKELTRTDWLRILDLPAARIPAVLIVRGTRNFRVQHRAMVPYFDNVLELGTPNGIIEDVLIGDVRGCPVAFACVYGSSMASEIVHIFGVLGTRVVLQIGNCGALADDLGAGDLLAVERAYCGEGAAQYYKTDGKWVSCSPRLLQSRTLLALSQGAYRTGAIYTTAALFAEGAEDVERWHREGFAAVDMETAATYAVAESFGMERLALLYGFDNPRQREHLLQSDEEKDRRRAAANEKMKRVALDLAVELCGQPVASAQSGTMVIRVARSDEIEAMLVLWRHADAIVTHTDTAEDVKRVITDSPAIVLVAECDGHLVGSVIGSFDGWRGQLYRLTVHPAYRRQGIARRLVAEVERRLLAMGVKRITALVHKDHPWAMGFWQAAGYETTPGVARFVRNFDATGQRGKSKS